MAYVQERFIATVRRYAGLYPYQRQSKDKLSSFLFGKLKETECFRSKRHFGCPTNRFIEQEDVLEQMENNPQLTIRRCRLSAATGISRYGALIVLHNQQLQPYHFTPTQNLLPVDLSNRLIFCCWMITKQPDPSTFSRMKLFLLTIE